MKHLNFSLIFIAFIALFVTVEASAQAKGIDTQTEKINTVNDPTRGNTGAGRGINWGKDKTPERKVFSNPYRLASRRDILLGTIKDVLLEKKLVLDEAASKPDKGMLVTQPFTFVKGTVVAKSELGNYANLPNTSETIWTRGRYSLIIEVQSIDGANNNITVTAKVEGRSETPLGAEWVTLQSSGVAEQKFLAALVEAVTGVSADDKIEDQK